MNRSLSNLGLIGLIILLTGRFAFADDLASWSFSKKLAYDNQEEVKAIYLDDEVYRHANQNLSDIRLVNEKGEFIPYYIYNGIKNIKQIGQETYTSQQILSYSKENNVYSDYHINKLEENQDVVGNSLVLEVGQKGFYKEIEVLGSYDNKTWESIISDVIYHINEQEKIQVPLGGTYKYPYYRIISLNDLTKLPIKELGLRYNHTETSYEPYTKFKTLDYQVESNKETKETVISIDNKDRLRISTIMIKSQGDFKRDYRLYTRQEEVEDLGQVGRGTIYQFNLEEAQIKDTRIQLEGLGDWFAPRFLQIVIDDRDDQPIVIDELEINYQIDKIVFKTTNSQDLRLLFGNKDAAKPEYDISSYKEEIEQSNQEEVVLLDLVKKDPGQSTGKKIDFKYILNICVVIISVLLVVLILGKTSKAD